MSLIPIIPGPNNELITQSLAVPPRYQIQADTAVTASFALNTPQKKWGSWYSTQEETASLVDTAYPVSVNTLVGAEGFYISGSNGSTVSGSVIVVPKTAVYNFQFSLQLENVGGGGGSTDADVWLRVNGNDVPWSATKVAMIPSSPYAVAAWNFMDTYNSGDKLQLMWAVSDTNVKISAFPATAPAPEIPPAILTIMEV